MGVENEDKAAFNGIYSWSLIAKLANNSNNFVLWYLPVVPHKAVAEVSD